MSRWESIKKWLEKPWAAYTFAICSGVVLFLFLSNLSILWNMCKAFYDYFSPVFTGLIIAYVLDPMVKFWETKVFKHLRYKAARALGIVVTFALIIMIIVILLIALIPQLISSVRMFIENLNSYGKTLNGMLSQLQEFASDHNMDISDYIASAGDIIGSIIDNLPQSVNGILNTTISYGVDLFNMIISCIIAAYLLMDKMRLMSGANRLWRAVTNEKSYRKTNNFLGRCNAIMIQFILTDLFDGFIIGILNAVFMLIVGYPYVPLISVVVGVTNLAPTFGPIVGAIIGGLILFLVNPWYALWFIVFTIVLQTMDGYVIKPKLFGDQLGVPSIWILISIIVLGRMLRVAGILLAIPFAAIFDFIYREEILTRLEDVKRRREARDTSGGKS